MTRDAKLTAKSRFHPFRGYQQQRYYPERISGFANQVMIPKKIPIKPRIRNRYRDPDDTRQILGRRAGSISRALRAALEAVALESYRSGTITPAEVHQMFGLRSRWQTESFLPTAGQQEQCQSLQARSLDTTDLTRRHRKAC